MFALINIIIYHKCKQFFDKSLHRHQSVIMHLHKIVTIFKLSTLKLNIFKYEIAKVIECKRLWRLGALPPDPKFFFALQPHGHTRTTFFQQLLVSVRVYQL